MNPSRRVLRRHLCLFTPMLLFALLRLPALIHQPGMQDEQWFAVPGLTVWQEGIPRIPYVPTRNRETLFENADVCLMALPPGLFYVQAPFFGVFPAGYATARLPLFLGALATIGIVFWIVKRLGGSDWAAGAAGLIVAISRPLLFTGLTTRPDLLSAVAGWLSIIAAWEMLRERGSNRFALVSGLLSGLAGLFHPFALVFGIQGGIAMLLGKEPLRQKTKRVALFVSGNVLMISLWIPLIVAYPYEFRSQFFANVLDRAGPGLPMRMLWPFPSLIHHAGLLYEFAGPFQCLLMAVGLVIGTGLILRHAGISIEARRGFVALAWSSVFLTATVAGHHPTKGYWTYPFVWITAMAVVGIESFLTRPVVQQAGLSGADTNDTTKAYVRRSVVPALTVLGLTVVLMIPGAGLRTTRVYLSQWKSPSVYAPAFIEDVLRELPREGIFYADLSYVFDVYLSGRETRLCQQREQYWGKAPIEYSYLILSWEGEDAGWAEQYDGLHVKRIGDRTLPQDCFVDLYVPDDPTHRIPTLSSPEETRSSDESR